MAKVNSAAIAALKALFETGDTLLQSSFEEIMDAIAEAAQDHTHDASGGSGSGTGDASSVVIHKTLVFCIPDTLEVGSAKAPSIIADAAMTIDKVYVYVRTAPTGAALIFDIDKNGTTIFTDQGKRPEIAIDGYTDESDTPDVTALAKNDRVDINVDQIGSSVAGADCSVFVRCTQINV